MKVQVLFFGATAEATGKREIEMDLANGVKSGAAFDEIRRKYPQLNQHSLLFSVNQEYASGDELIKNGDELAIFTMVSGG